METSILYEHFDNFEDPVSPAASALVLLANGRTPSSTPKTTTIPTPSMPSKSSKGTPKSATSSPLLTIQTEDANGKKRRNRVALSCLQCKTRKVRCDRAPRCGNCVRRGEECQWSPSRDLYNQQLLQREREREAAAQVAREVSQQPAPTQPSPSLRPSSPSLSSRTPSNRPRPLPVAQTGPSPNLTSPSLPGVPTASPLFNAGEVNGAVGPDEFEKINKRLMRLENVISSSPVGKEEFGLSPVTYSSGFNRHRSHSHTGSASVSSTPRTFPSVGLPVSASRLQGKNVLESRGGVLGTRSGGVAIRNLPSPTLNLPSIFNKNLGSLSFQSSSNDRPQAQSPSWNSNLITSPQSHLRSNSTPHLTVSTPRAKDQAVLYDRAILADRNNLTSPDSDDYERRKGNLLGLEMRGDEGRSSSRGLNLWRGREYEDDVREAVRMLNDSEIVERLLERYLIYLSPLLLPLHGPTLRSFYSSFRANHSSLSTSSRSFEEPDPALLSLLLAVCCISERFGSKNAEANGEVWFTMAYRILTSSGLFLNPSLESLQAMFLLYLWLEDRPTEQSSSAMLLGITLRGAETLGLNKLGNITGGGMGGMKEELFGNAIQLEQSKRLWWTLVCEDEERLVCEGAARRRSNIRSPSGSPSQARSSLPANVEDDDITETRIITSRSLERYPTIMSWHLVRVMIDRRHSRAMELINSAEEGSRVEEAVNQVSQLASGYKALPSYLIPSLSTSIFTDSSQPLASHQALLLSLHYHSLTLSLLKPYLYQSLSNPITPFSLTVVESVVQSAQSVLMTFQNAKAEKFPLIDWARTVRKVFRAALCLMMYHVRDSSFGKIKSEDGEDDSFDSKEIVKEAAELLRALSNSSESEACAECLLSLLKQDEDRKLPPLVAPITIPKKRSSEEAGFTNSEGEGIERTPSFKRPSLTPPYASPPSDGERPPASVSSCVTAMTTHSTESFSTTTNTSESNNLRFTPTVGNRSAALGSKKFWDRLWDFDFEKIKIS